MADRVGLRVMQWPHGIHFFGVLWRECGRELDEHRVSRVLTMDGAAELNAWDGWASWRRGDTTERFTKSDALWEQARKDARKLWGWTGEIMKGGPWKG